MEWMRTAFIMTLFASFMSGDLLAAAKWPDSQQSPSAQSSAPAKTSADPEFQVKMDQLMVNSQSWNSLSSVEKLQAVEFVIQFFKVKQNIAILKPASFYAERLNEHFNADPGMMSLPFPIALKVLSVMEYDFYNGEDKDQLAAQTLGPQLAEELKKKRQEMGI